jgi:hypothetical protein
MPCRLVLFGRRRTKLVWICHELIARVPDFSLFLMEQIMYIQQGLASIFLVEVAVLFRSGLQGTLRYVFCSTK